jgi:hypothetical protein
MKREPSGATERMELSPETFRDRTTDPEETS